MKHTFHIKMCAALWAGLSVACFASAPAMAGEPAWWTQQKRDCGLPYSLAYNNWDGNCNSSSSSSSENSGADEAGRRVGAWLRCKMFGSGCPDETSPADQARQQAHEANEQGIAAFNKRDWATAISYFQQALQYRDDAVFRQNLANAQANMTNQQASEKAEREAAERLRQNKAAADNMQQSIHNFAQTLNAAPVSGGLDFDGHTAGNATGGNSGGLDFTATVATPSKSASGNPMVVDARSGLPKSVDNAIASHYADAPPGVSDRVRKGFQAVMARDWKVAKAWFRDALNRDPNNAGLKRLVALTDSSQQPEQHSTVDARNEPQNKPKPASAANPNLQLPSEDDLYLLFPGLQAMKDREAPVFKTLPDGRVLQMPQDSDMEYLFGTTGAASASPAPLPTYIIGKDGNLLQVPQNSHQESQIYSIGKDGKLIELPRDSDNLFLFPGNSPVTAPKPAVESGKVNN